MRGRLRDFMFILLASGSASADTVTIGPARDNTLYQELTGTISNGAGAYFFAGQAAAIRRGLVAFDIAHAVPSGATIEAVTLTLHCSRRPAGEPDVAITVHRVLADWGEGGSDAGAPGGGGAPAAAGDATWIHTFFDTAFWTNPGGDFVATASASQMVGDTGDYVWASTPELVADVQGWLDNPATSFGWMLRGAEGAGTNSRRFDAQENSVAAFRPRLQIDYTPRDVGVAPAAWTRVKALYHD
jgi:hypothetical protein